MSKCPDCHTDMKPLFSMGEFCPNECDLPIEKRTVKPSPDPNLVMDPSERVEYCALCGRKGIQVVITTAPSGTKEIVFVCAYNHSWFSALAPAKPAGYFPIPGAWATPVSNSPYTIPLYPFSYPTPAP